MHCIRFMLGSLLTAGLVVVVAAASGALAFPGGGSDRGSRTLDRLSDPTYRAHPINAAAVDLEATFSVLTEPTDELPANVAEQLSEGTVLAQTFAPNAALAHSVRLPKLRPGEKVWVIPGRDSVCLYVPDAEGRGLSCQATEDADRGALVITLYPSSGPATVTGLTPDGVDHVTVFDDHGHATASPVHQNVYAAATDRPATLTVGSSTIPLPTAPSPPSGSNR